MTCPAFSVPDICHFVTVRLTAIVNISVNAMIHNIVLRPMLFLFLLSSDMGKVYHKSGTVFFHLEILYLHLLPRFSS